MKRTSGKVTDHLSVIPKVSVIIPVYNVEKYLCECLESVVHQTLRDIEIICVNDCTPDNCQEILDGFSDEDERFVVINHDQNKGLAAARNTGLKVAKGTYIYFLDSDDFLCCDDGLESLFEAAIRDNADEAIGGILKWREDTGEEYLDWHKNYLSEEIHGKTLEEIPGLSSNVVAVNKLLKRSLLQQYGITFNDKLRKYEDNPFSVQVHILADKISIITKNIYIYRQLQSDSLMSTDKESDAYACSNYCFDIFSFIEADTSRHIYRKTYYPMYSRQLIRSAEILSRFSPSESEKIKLLQQWKEIVDILPVDFPEIPSPQREVFEQVKNGDLSTAWALAHEFGQKTLKEDQHQLEVERLEELNTKLASQIEMVYKSKSWRMTAPCRAVRRFFRGY